jgi:CheY-like chemotaxis protein
MCIPLLACQINSRIKPVRNLLARLFRELASELRRIGRNAFAAGRAMKDHLRIAIADDDGVGREFLFLVLSRMGHEVVTTAENGRQLADYCLQSPPDLVITDVQMPQVDGISAAAEITRLHDVPIVLLSGSDLPREIEQLDHARVVMRRVKPISRSKLEALIAEVQTLSNAFAAVS